MLLNRKCIISVLLLALLTASCDELLNQAQDSETPPDTPRSLIVQLTTSFTIEMSWSDESNDENGFRIEYQTSGSIVWNYLGETSANQTSYTWTGAEEGKSYTFRVCAWNSTDDSEWTYSSSVNVPLRPPTDLYTNLTVSGIELQWSDNTQYEENYVIEREVDGSSFSVLGQVERNEIYYTDEEYPEDAEIGYRVKAVSSTASSDYSNIAYINTPPHINSPSNLTVVLVDGQPELSWTDNTEDEDGFRIERKYSYDTDFYYLANVDRNVTTYLDGTANPESEIAYRVSAFVGVRFSDPSNEATITTPSLPTQVAMDDFNGYTTESYFTGSTKWFVYTSSDQTVYYITEYNELNDEGNNLSFWDSEDESWGYADFGFDGVNDGWVEFDVRVTASPGLQNFLIALSVDQMWTSTDDFGPHLEFDSNGYLQAFDGSDLMNAWIYPTDQWMHMRIEFNATQGKFSVNVNGEVVISEYDFRDYNTGNALVGFTIAMFSNALLDLGQIDNLEVYDSNTGTQQSVPVARLDPATREGRLPIVNR